MQLVICKASFKDLEVLQKISRKTFYDTFSEFNTREDMQHYLEFNLGKEQLKAELNNANTDFYFVLHQEEVIGFLKLNRESAQTEHRTNTLEIERVYVIKEYLGKGVGQFLLDYAVKETQRLGFKTIWLGVWEHNSRAIAFYRKNGFKEFGHHSFILGKDEQLDILMEKFV